MKGIDLHRDFCSRGWKGPLIELPPNTPQIIIFSFEIKPIVTKNIFFICGI
jgi:hypothetical protein